MALKTQGFALSALPRAPQIPKNIGQIDVKEIYDGVRRGLESFELARRAPQSMALADAQMQAGIAQAPLQTRGILAETEAKEAQLPMKTAILAHDASPEMLAAKQKALENRYVKPLTGIPFLLDRVAGLEQAAALDPSDQLIATALADARSKLTEARDIAAANVAGRKEVASDKNATTLTITEQTDQRLRDLSAQTQKLKKELAANQEQMKRDIAEANRLSAEKQTGMRINAPTKETEPGLQVSNKLERADELLRTARKELEVAIATGDEDLIAAGQEEVDLSTTRREAAQKAYTLYHDERKRKTIADKDDPLIAAINARNARKGVTPTPTVPPSEWTEVTLPNGTKVKKRVVKP